MELRKDYILERYVVIAEKRGKRPHEHRQEPDVYSSGTCYFCPGNESLTPPEIGRIEKGGRWVVRWFPNKFGILERQGEKRLRTDNDYFTFAAAFGEHEVISETPEHNKHLHDLGVPEIRDVLSVYCARISELSTRNEYVVVFKNHGKDGGASLLHSHSQLAAVNILPPFIREESEASMMDGKCRYCDILNVEKQSLRRVFENEFFVSFCPYASRFNFEVWLFPKRHVKNITELSGDELYKLAEMLKQVLTKLAELNADYNFVLHYAPKGSDLHFHIEIMPRLAVWAGFELSSGIIVNQVSPEMAAGFYRNEIM